MQIYLCELETLALFKELPTSLLDILELSEELFCQIIIGNYAIEEAKKVFNPYFYNSLEANLDCLEYTKVL